MSAHNELLSIQQELDTISSQLSSQQQQLAAASTAVGTLQQRCVVLKQQLQEDFDTRVATATEIIEKITKRSKNVKNKIKLNIGGTLYVTTRDTLLNAPMSFFAGMFSENFDTQPDEDGEYFIDRDPKHFSIIVNHLRGVDVSQEIAALSKVERSKFEQEVAFYNIESLMVKLPNNNKIVLSPVWRENGSKTMAFTSPNPSGYSCFLVAEGFQADDGTRRKFSVRIVEIADTWSLVISVATELQDSSKWLGNATYGWGMNQSGYKVYNSGSGLTYANSALAVNDVVTVILPGDGTIEFAINGVNKGKAFENLQAKVYPAASFSNTGGTLTFL